MFRRQYLRVSILIGIFILALTSACTSSNGTPGSPGAPLPPLVVVPATNPGIPPPAIAAKQLRSTKTVSADSALDRGILIYTPLTQLIIDSPTEFYVTVIDVGKGSQLASAQTKYRGQAVDSYDVPTSAGVEVQIVCSSNLRCEDGTSQDGQFVDPKHEGYWRWSVTALESGSAYIGIIAVTYKKGAGTFLHGTPLWTVKLEVKGAGA